LIFALLADLVILPALVLVSSRWKGRLFLPSDTDTSVAVAARRGDKGQPRRRT
jgi:hypothetical protein